MDLNNNKRSGKARLLIASGTLEPGQGGICRVSRLMAKCAINAGIDTRLVTYLDQKKEMVAGQASIPAKASKPRFAANCWGGALTRTHFIYDHVGLASAHLRLFGKARPYGLWIHSYEVWEDMPEHHHRIVRNADIVFVNSNNTLRVFEELHGKLETARVCWLATTEDEDIEHQADFPKPPAALILGRMSLNESHKGHDQLIACWPEVVTAIPGAHLMIAGGGSDIERIRAMAEASPASESIEMLGFVPEEQIEGVWSRTHVYAMPARGEGFGLVYIEAMRRGLPVIATVHDAGGEINSDGITGFNVNLDRQGELAKKLILLLGSSDQCRKLGNNAVGHWRKNFCYSTFERRFLPLLMDFLET